MKAHFLDGLAAFGHGITAARRAFAVHPDEAANTIRRIARVMLNLDGIRETPELFTACQSIIDADQPELPGLATTLIEIVRHLVKTLAADRAVILIVDDEPVISHVLSTRLRSPTREIVVAKTAAEALDIIQHRLISLVIQDLGLPDRDGRDVLADIRMTGLGNALPVIVLSAHEDPWVKTECFALGADEYFEKPVDIEMLTTAISAKLQRVAEIGQKLRRDPLTGALNRFSFTEVFVRQSAFMSRAGGEMSIAILDLDKFKSVNDTYGHGMGDEVLQKTANVLEKALRASDAFCRWGGEEFVVLFPGTDCAGAAQALEHVAGTLRAIEFTASRGSKFNVTFSAGVVSVGGATVDVAVAEADVLLYRAKHEGRDRIIKAG